MKAGGIKPVSISSPWCSVIGFQQDIWICKVGPLINVSVKSIVLMYLLSLDPFSESMSFLEVSGLFSPWEWIHGHLLSPCCMRPCLQPYLSTPHLTCPPFVPISSCNSAPWWGTVLSFTFIVCLHTHKKKQCTTVTERRGTWYTDIFVLCWGWLSRGWVTQGATER